MRIKHVALVWVTSLFIFGCGQIEPIQPNEVVIIDQNCSENLGDVTDQDFFISTPEQVNQFLESPFREINGQLTVSNLTDLSFLNCLEKVRSLEITRCDVQDLSGLQNLQEVDDLTISGMNQLENFRGLGALREIKYLELRFNNSIENFKGLDALESIGSMWVENNENLDSFDGLENVTSNPFYIPDTDFLTNFAYWRIRENPNLNSIAGLDGISGELTAFLRIFENPSLVDLGSFESVTKITGLLIANCPMITTVSCFPSAQESGAIGMDSLSSLTSISFPALELASYIGIERNENLTSLDFGALNEISGGGNGDFSMKINDNMSLTSLDGFESLVSNELIIDINTTVLATENPLVNVCALRNLFINQIQTGIDPITDNSVAFVTPCSSNFGFQYSDIAEFDAICQCN